MIVVALISACATVVVAWMQLSHRRWLDKNVGQANGKGNVNAQLEVLSDKLQLAHETGRLDMVRHEMMDDARFNRIEAKIDGVAECDLPQVPSLEQLDDHHA